MENTVVYAVLLPYFIYEAIGGEYCEVTSQSVTVTQYCEVGGCCIPGNAHKLTNASELCCINFLMIILIGIFVGLPILILLVICLVIVVNRCVKNRKQTTLTSLTGTANGLAQYQPKPPEYTREEHVAGTCPVYSPPRTWQPRPSLVLPGAISHTATSQHAQPVPSGSYHETDLANLPTSPPPPYSSRASGSVPPMETLGSSSSMSSVSAPGSRGFAIPIATDSRQSGSPSPIVMADLTDTENEAPEDNDLAFI